MPAGCKRILSRFAGCKKRKACNNTREKYIPEKGRQNLTAADRESFYNHEEWVEEFLDDKDAFYSGSEDDDGDNNDENYNKNIEAIILRCSSR